MPRRAVLGCIRSEYNKIVWVCARAKRKTMRKLSSAFRILRIADNLECHMNVPPIGRAFTSEPGVFRLQWGCCHFALFPREFKRDVAVTGEDFRNEKLMSMSPVGKRYQASHVARVVVAPSAVGTRRCCPARLGTRWF